MANLKVIGVMTGTSCDGLDAVCVEFAKTKGRVTESARGSLSVPFSAELRARLLQIQTPKSKHSLAEIMALHRDLGQWYGSTLKAFAKKTKANYIALHGQTVFHQPPSQIKRGMTLQLGDPAIVSYETQCSVISQFRTGDMAAFGQGAPLAPTYHRHLFEQLPKTVRQNGVVFQNIGGIANLTYLLGDQTLAFDSGPGGVLIDEAVNRYTGGGKTFDKNGALARSFGALNHRQEKTIRAMLASPYFKLSPPKSTGRDDFNWKWFSKFTGTHHGGLEEIALATELTARSIAHSYQHFILSKRKPLRHVYLCGGGAFNSFLIARLQALLTNVEIKTTDALKINPTHIEARAFAYLGYRALHGQPLGGTWTGVKTGAKSSGRKIPSALINHLI